MEIALTHQLDGLHMLGELARRGLGDGRGADEEGEEE
jgi:hypothetical protein